MHYCRLTWLMHTSIQRVETKSQVTVAQQLEVRSGRSWAVLDLKIFLLGVDGRDLGTELGSPGV